MRVRDDHSIHPQLREVVVEASLALAGLDADRLEELAISCRALNRDLSSPRGGVSDELKRQACEARGEMAVFGRVLEATRANLEVMNELTRRELGRGEYGASSFGSRSAPWRMIEGSHGHH